MEGLASDVLKRARASQSPAPRRAGGALGLLALSFWMLWQQLLWSLYNSQISETLDSKQTVPPHSLPMLGTAEGQCLCSWNSFLETTSTYHWSLTRATSLLPITCLTEGLGRSVHTTLEREVIDPARC